MAIDCLIRSFASCGGVLDCPPSIFKDECIEPIRTLHVCFTRIPPRDTYRISKTAARRFWRAWAGPKQTENQILERLLVAVILSGVAKNATGVSPDVITAVACCCICSARFTCHACKDEVRKWEQEQRQEPLAPPPPSFPLMI